MFHQIEKVSVSDLPIDIVKNLSFWSSPELLVAFARRHEVALSYICISKNDSVLLCMPIFEKKKFFLRYTHQLNTCYYTPIDFFLDPFVSICEAENEKLKLVRTLANFLKKRYVNINIKISPEYQDMRAFLWAGLRAEPLYTHRKLISEYDSATLPRSVKRTLKKAWDTDIVVSELWDQDSINTLLAEMCNKKGISRYSLSEPFRIFLEELHKKGLCRPYIVYSGGEPIAFRVTLVSEPESRVYDFLAGANKHGYDVGGNIFCLDYIFGSNKDFCEYDFCGANIESIAFFKSQFQCRLVSYYKIFKK
jgi:hypothetical protein